LFEAEKEVAIPGNEYNVFDINGYKVGVAICYDLVFPEAIRILVLKGAELIFVPSRIKRISYEGWKIYALARALENRVHLACPVTLLQPEFPGKSFVADFDIFENRYVIPKIAKFAEEYEAILIYDFEPEKLEILRKERLKSGRPETYSYLVQI
jgi:omega-amidase